MSEETERPHSVARHLDVAPSDYDREIRRLVPAYDEMLEEIRGALEDHLPRTAPRVLDLGAGTGRVASLVAERFAHARIFLLDADADMLAVAKHRLAAHADRVEAREGSFDGPLPRVDAIVASLSLHHVRAADAKRATYAHLFRSLDAPGLLVVADAMVPSSRALADPIYRRWAAHLVLGGDTEAAAYARFESWAKEERYYGVAEELEMIRAAGFEEVEVRFRRGPLAVVVARRA